MQQGADNSSSVAVTKLRAPAAAVTSKPRHKFTVLKPGAGGGLTASAQNSSYHSNKPVVTNRVIRNSGSPVSANTAVVGNKINVTQTLRTAGNTNAPVSTPAESSSTTMVATRKAYERHGTQDFLKRYTVSGGAVKPMPKKNEDNKVETSSVATPSTARKTLTKPSPNKPAEINIFSALDEELSNPKKKEPPKKIVSKIVQSGTYQPPAKTLTVVSPQPILACQESEWKENENEKEGGNFFDKFNKGKDWLLEFSGSPTKSPTVQYGSTVDQKDSSDDMEFPVECTVQLARDILKPEHLEKIEKLEKETEAEKPKLADEQPPSVISISSSSDMDEPRDDVGKDPNFKEATADDNDALLASESDSSAESSKKEEPSKSESRARRKNEEPPWLFEKELSFVEARSRRKRKPPTYFGYEDHELSYNHGLNLVMNASGQGQDDTDGSGKQKKKPGWYFVDEDGTPSSPAAAVDTGTTTGTAASKKKSRSTSSRRVGADSDEQEEDAKSTTSEQSSGSRTKRKQKPKPYTVGSDSSDEEVLTSVARKEKSQRSTGSSDSNNTSNHSRQQPTVTSSQDNDVKTTAFRLYYKDVLGSVQSDETDTDKITKIITQMWFDLDKSQRENFENQARQLSQICLPPSPQKSKPQFKEKEGSANEEKSSNENKTAKTKNNDSKSKDGKESNGSSKESRDGGILGKMAADLQTTSDDSSADDGSVKENSSSTSKKSSSSSTSSEEGSPVRLPKPKIKKPKPISIRNSSRSPTPEGSPVRLPKPKPKKVKPPSPPWRNLNLPETNLPADDSTAESTLSSDSSIEKRVVKKKRKKITSRSVPGDASGIVKPKTVSKSSKTPVQPSAPVKKVEPKLPKICFNCPKEAIECTLWSSDGQYCSISCCVLHCKKLYNDWVAERKRRAELEREQNENDALKHAKDFFCIETEEVNETEANDAKSIDHDSKSHQGLEEIEKQPQVVEIEAD